MPLTRRTPRRRERVSVVSPPEAIHEPETAPSPSIWEMKAVIFDMDGVVTDTARAHAGSWAKMFDEYLKDRSDRTGEPFRPFGEADYLAFVDGKPRYDGVRGFLESRGITVPDGTPDDPPSAETICGLGNRKNARFLQVLEEQGADAYPSTVRLIEELHRRGIATAVITSSRNSEAVLGGADVRHLFEVKVDGIDSTRLGLAGKPSPDIFLEAARGLGVSPDRAVVVEDALSGVEAGRRGGFGIVIGVNRGAQAEELAARGADIVVSDLGELLPGALFRDHLPSALDGGVESALQGRRPALFFDYDGTLTPIVSHPSEAVLSHVIREELAQLASKFPVAIISGRDRGDVEAMVGLEDICYAGSHGFDVSRPGEPHEERGSEYAASLRAAANELEARIANVDGSWVERKKYAVAVHFRQSAPEAEDLIRAAAEEVAAEHRDLRISGGKKIIELRPDLDWDKGHAVFHLLEVMDLNHPDVLPVYLGDDETDEDVFRAFGERGGIGIVVGTEHRETLARFALADSDEVRLFLARLARIGEE